MTFGFSFFSEADSDLYRSLASLCKSNGGFFKSTKQRWFLFAKSLAPWGMDPCNEKRENYTGISEADVLKAKDFFGVDVAVGQRLYMVSASMRWAAGTRARREVEWAFVVDAYGVVRKYRLHRAYNARGTASSINAEKTKVEFERPADAVLPPELTPEAPKAAEPVEAGEHVGKVGVRGEFEVTVDFVKYLGAKQVAYGVCAESYITVMHDAAGNTIKAFGSFGGKVAKGDKLKVKGTVRDHSYYKGRCETILSRVLAC